MKLSILISLFLIATFLFTSCSSDSSNAADLFCENSELKTDLQNAMDKQDEEKIIEISDEIHVNNSELEKLFVKYEDKDNAQEFYDELFTELESCESISKEEIEKIKEYIKNPKVIAPKRRIRNVE